MDLDLFMDWWARRPLGPESKRYFTPATPPSFLERKNVYKNNQKAMQLLLSRINAAPGPQHFLIYARVSVHEQASMNDEDIPVWLYKVKVIPTGTIAP